MTDKKKKPKYLLRDVEVSTVGLVSRGANQETFFLLKSQQEEPMPEIQEEVQEETQAGTELEEEVVKTDPEMELVQEPEQEPEQELEPVVQTPFEKEEIGFLKRLANFFGNPNVQVVEPEAAGDDPVEETPVSKAEEELAALQKRQVELEAELAKARQEAEEQRTANEESTMLAKAAGLTAFSATSDELAQHLYAIHKLDAEQAEWLFGFLQTVDAQLKEGELFVEKGTSELTDQPEGIVAMAMQMVEKGEAPDFKAALFAIDRAEADAFLAKRRSEIRGK